ncbi:hypothetical protein [Chitiniphilus eburneus]|uniref:Uncharacterized protein n=1 Tax=Chitiniphilus eburneus TaxID=2571148 RepID=A0A4U0QBH1_9NEIS|nr:hypothetical protein [Chitiniphilus eburneus]TJZ73184.1 hypothetical protein FAZ21_11240 [Chitiniphilus eburneus]
MDEKLETAFLAKQAAETRKEAQNIAGGRPLVRDATQKLRMATISFNDHAQHLASPTGSPHLELIKEKLGDIGLGRMFQRQKMVHEQAETMRGQDFSKKDIGDMIPKRMAQLGNNQNSPVSRLKVESSGGVGAAENFYDPTANKVKVFDSRLLPFATHELRHAYDHLTQKLDLNNPEHRLASEFNAFSSQQKAANELHVPSGFQLPPLDQAKTYEQKTKLRDVYPGTVESSLAAVKKWQQTPEIQQAQEKRLHPFQALKDSISYQRKNTWVQETPSGPWVKKSRPKSD